MKALIEVNGHSVKMEAETGEIIDLLNSLSKAKVEREVVATVVPRKRKRFLSEKWTEEEVMQVVEVVSRLSTDTFGAADIVSKQLKGKIKRTSSSLHNMGYRIHLYMHVKGNGAYLSTSTKNILWRNGVRQYRDTVAKGQLEVVEA